MKFISISVLVILCLQSLADVAREEAERRSAMDRQGVEAKVIDSIPQNENGNMTLSTGPLSPKLKEPPPAKDKASVHKISGDLQRLDRKIRQTQDRLELRRVRLQTERWAIPKTGKVSGHGDTERTQNRLLQEIVQLQKSLEQLQQERRDLYDRGLKAGYLPGELTGKGITP
jgi:hypothetical protein